MKIEDGAGTGRLAEVDEDQRLSVSSIASDRAEAANNDKKAFILATDIFSIGAATEHRVGYIKNGESQTDMIIDLEKLFCDGGTTSNSKPVIVRFYLNASAPATNEVSKDPIGTNTATGQSSAEFVVWDGVATGFTQVSAGDLLGTLIIGLGFLDNKIPSKLILGPAKTITYSFECEEAAKVGFQTYIHLA